jgi:hypothetical protein
MAWTHELPDERDLVGDGEPVVHLNAVEADGSGADDLSSTFADYSGFAEVGLLGAMEGRD